ncbi:TRAP transporter small permease [Lentibacillus jeotgali]|uniref:TRAP transporter small permease n=1 Tax=Lentibacillus jeotgali TaxID=558169 RepID=UPI0002628853|nr:TRAP transporter small permease [Lentibacillus jeotgali]
MKILRWLDEHLEEYILIALSCFTVAVIFLQVFMRFILSDSLSWSEEIARYAFIWMIYIGVSYGVKKQKHLGVDAFAMLFEKTGKIVIGIIANICFLIFAVVITVYGVEIVTKITRESAALQLPMGWVYAAPAVGMFLTVIRLVQNLIKQFQAIGNTKANSDDYQEQGGII